VTERGDVAIGGPDVRAARDDLVAAARGSVFIAFSYAFHRSRFRR
jgi:hypothetical protein